MLPDVAALAEDGRGRRSCGWRDRGGAEAGPRGAARREGRRDRHLRLVGPSGRQGGQCLRRGRSLRRRRSGRSPLGCAGSPVPVVQRHQGRVRVGDRRLQGDRLAAIAAGGYAADRRRVGVGPAQGENEAVPAPYRPPCGELASGHLAGQVYVHRVGRTGREAVQLDPVAACGGHHVERPAAPLPAAVEDRLQVHGGSALRAVQAQLRVVVGGAEAGERPAAAPEVEVAPGNAAGSAPSARGVQV